MGVILWRPERFEIASDNNINRSGCQNIGSGYGIKRSECQIIGSGYVIIGSECQKIASDDNTKRSDCQIIAPENVIYDPGGKKVRKKCLLKPEIHIVYRTMIIFKWVKL